MGKFGSDQYAESSTGSTTRTTEQSPTGTVRNEPTYLSRGEAHRFNKPSSDKAEVKVTSHSKGTDTKFALSALVLYRDGQQVYVGREQDADQKETNEHAVRHHGERMLGLSDDEKISLKWDDAIESVAIAARAWDEGAYDTSKSKSQAQTSQSQSMSQSWAQSQFSDLKVRFECGDQTVEISPQQTGSNLGSSMLVGKVDYNTDGSMTIRNQEQFASPNAPGRMSFADGEIRMDSGPASQVR
jgi:hypothetical protein